jgi:D-alanine-D-alanine ligase
VVVLYGGRSAEHDISCISARFVLTQLEPSRYDVVPVGITHDGRWVDARRLVAGTPDTEGALPSPDRAEPADSIAVGALPEAEGEQETVVFPLLHGPMGEDGTVQGLFEVAGVPYVGAGVLASALCMDKTAAKEVLAHHGVPQGRWLARRVDLVDAGFCDRVEADLGYPMFVKPANLGSSIGITKAHRRGELEAAIGLAATYDDAVVFEANIEGREVEVAVLGNEAPRASLPGEIVSPDGFYDYEEKYLNDRAKLEIPAPLSDEEVARVQETAVAAYRALRVEGMARVDFFYATGRFLVNEVNTIPGFTPISMYPKLWEVSGLAPGRLLDELIALALERHRRRAAHRVER